MQDLVAGFIEEFGLDTGREIRYLDLVSEIGELGKELIKCSDYGKKDFEMTPEVAGELGDCLFSMLALCKELGVDAELALAGVMDKYRARFERRGSVGSDAEM